LGAGVKCSGPCYQGRERCPTPEACERDSNEAEAGWTIVLLAITLLMAAITIGLVILGALT
jgi:hypothetical protein